MTSSFEVTRLYATISPKLAVGFKAEVNKMVKAAVKDATVGLKIKVDPTSLAAAKRQIENRLNGANVKLKVTIDESSLKRVGNKTVMVDVKTNAKKAEREVKQSFQKIEGSSLLFAKHISNSISSNLSDAFKFNSGDAGESIEKFRIESERASKSAARESEKASKSAERAAEKAANEAARASAKAAREVEAAVKASAREAEQASKKMAREAEKAAREASKPIKINVNDTDLEKLRFETLKARAAARGINIKVDVDDKTAEAKLVAISRNRKVEIKVDTDKSLSSQANALLSAINPKGGGNGGALGAFAEAGESLGKAFSRMSDIAGTAGLAVQGVGKAVQFFTDAAQQGAEEGESFGKALTEGIASVASAGIVGAIAAAIIVLASALAAGALAAAGFAIAAVILGAVLSAIAVAALGAAAALTALVGVVSGLSAAFGVAALALYPIIQAFQEFSTVQNEAPPAAKKVTKAVNAQTAAMRTAATAIRAAGRAVADANHAVAESQYGIIQAQRGVRDSAQSLKDAYVNQKQARQNLNDAEERALENLKNLSRQSRDAAGQEEDAAIAHQRAVERLNALDPGTASQLDYREALREVERTARNLSDTQEDNIVTEKKYQDAKKKGVKGDKDVIAAQQAKKAADDGVTHAIEAKKDAEHNLANAYYNTGKAIEAQRDAILRLRDAQAKQGETIANNTTAYAGQTAAQRKLGKAYGQLTALGKKFFDQIKGIYGFVLKLSGIAQDAFLPGLGRALQSMTVLGPAAEKAVSKIGTTMGNVADEFGRIFSSAEGQTAFNSLVDTSNEVILSIGSAAAEITKVLLPAIAQLADASKPVVQAFSDGFVLIGGSIRDLFGSLAQPRVVKAMSDLALVISNVVGVVITKFGTFIENISATMSHISPQISDALTKLVGGLFDAMSVLINSGIVEQFIGFVGDIGSSLEELSKNGFLEVLGFTMGQTLKIIGEGIRTIMSDPGINEAFIKLFAVMPPLIKEFLDQLIPAIPAFLDFIRYSSELLTSILSISGLAAQIRILADILLVVAIPLEGFVSILKMLWEWIQKIGSAIGDLFNKVGVGSLLRKLGIIGNDDAKKLNETADAADSVNSSMQNYGETAQGVAGQIHGMNDGLTTSSNLFGENAKKALELTDAVGQLRAKIDAAAQAEEQSKRVTNAWKTAKEQLTEAVKKNGDKIIGNTQAAKDNREAFKNATKASYDLMLQDVLEGKPLEESISRHKKRTIELQKEFGQSQATKEETGRLITKYGEIPKDKATLLKLLGYDSVDQGMKALLSQQRALQLGISPAQAAAEVQKDIDRTNWAKSHFARGGKIYGPGSGTSDDVPIMASNDEWVIRAKSAKKLGYSKMRHINETGTLPPESMFAEGGQVGRTRTGPWVFPTDVSKSKIDPKWARLYAAESAAGETAGTVFRTAKAMNASAKVLLAAFETGLVESNMKNLASRAVPASLRYPHEGVAPGDYDSIGVFQQRASWGSVKSRMNVADSTRRFIRKAKAREDRYNSAGSLAQAVQVSAFPTKYNEARERAMALLGLAEQPPVVPGGSVRGGGIGYRAMIKLVNDAGFNYHPSRNQTIGGGHAKGSYHYLGRAVDLAPPTAEAYRWLLQNYGRSSKELIYAPFADSNIKNGKTHRYSQGILANHFSHIHWAMKKGGLVSGLGGGMSDKVIRALSNGEYVLNAQATKAIGVDNLNHWNEMGNNGSSASKIQANAGLANAKIGGGNSEPSQLVNNQRYFNVSVQTTDLTQTELLANRLNSML